MHIYSFVSVYGHSKFGSYEGNGNADGTFVYTGFSPAFVMVKSLDSTSDWEMYDNVREGYNVKILDVFTDEELINRSRSDCHLNESDTSRIEKVDFVFKVDSHHYKWEER